MHTEDGKELALKRRETWDKEGKVVLYTDTLTPGVQRLRQYKADGLKLIYNADENLIAVLRSDGSRVEADYRDGKMNSVRLTQVNGQVTAWRFDEGDMVWKADNARVLPQKAAPFDNTGRLRVLVPGQQKETLQLNILPPSGKHSTQTLYIEVATVRADFLKADNDLEEVRAKPALLDGIKGFMSDFEEQMLLRAELREQNLSRDGQEEKYYVCEAQDKICQTYKYLEKILTSSKKTVFEQNPPPKAPEGVTFSREYEETGSAKISRFEAVHEFLFHIGSKGMNTVDQNFSNVCSLSNGEKFLYAAYPERSAKMLFELMFDCAFEITPGQWIPLPLGALRPGQTEQKFTVENGRSNSLRSKVSKLIHNAAGSAMLRLVRNLQNAVFDGHTQWDPRETRRFTEIFIGEKVPWMSDIVTDFSNSNTLAKMFAKGQVVVVAESSPGGGGHVTSINALYKKKDDGTIEVRIFRDNQHGEAGDGEHYLPSPAGVQAASRRF